MPTNAEKLLKLTEEKGLLRTRDLLSEGIPRVTLTRLLRTGLIERVARGLYSLPDADVSELHALAEACKRVPHGIVCLLSALRFHELTMLEPFDVWLAIDRKARKPRVEYPPLRIVRFSGEALANAVDEHNVEGVTVRITSPARTVADCFRYRNKIGIDVAVEALRDYLRKSRRRPTSRERRALRKGGGHGYGSGYGPGTFRGDGHGDATVFSVDALVDAARAVRVYTVMRPYLEALS
jgi:predicted transcriptional regulator of viral defense system